MFVLKDVKCNVTKKRSMFYFFEKIYVSKYMLNLMPAVKQLWTGAPKEIIIKKKITWSDHFTGKHVHWWQMIKKGQVFHETV